MSIPITYPLRHAGFFNKPSVTATGAVSMM